MEYISETVTKSTGFYRCPDNISNFKIRIKIKEVLPSETQHTSNANFIEREFSWQEKWFSRTQKEYYKDERNCISEREKEYHSLVGELIEENEYNILFSYVNEEHFCAESDNTGKVNYLEKAMTDLDLKCPVENNGYSFHESLQRSIEYPLIRSSSENMYLMADFGEYFEDTWLKNETLLCSLKYDSYSKVLQIFPDFTTTHPYIVKLQNVQERTFYYFIENCSHNIPESTEAVEKALLEKINNYRQLVNNQLVADPFKLPPKNKLYVYLFGEISSGKQFEYPDVYVQYTIYLPDDWHCLDSYTLTGRTQTCRRLNDEGIMHFGYCFDTLLEYNFMSLEKKEFPRSPCIYFEVISKDFWDRYRTEGLCYLNLPLSHPGNFEYNMNCLRFTSNSPVSEMKRFFIGDCQNYDDLQWIRVPRDHEGKELNKYGIETIGTGELKVKLSIVHQSEEFLDKKSDSVEQTRRMIFEKLGSSKLIKSVEQVIQEFKKARKEMLEARKNIK